VALGNVLINDGHVLVPKKEYIGQYGKLQDIFDAAKDHRRLEKYFVVREDQMMRDFQELKQHMNALWEKPIVDLTKLLSEDKNVALMAKYNLLLT
jgi:hypothetical protein